MKRNTRRTTLLSDQGAVVGVLHFHGFWTDNNLHNLNSHLRQGEDHDETDQLRTVDVLAERLVAIGSMARGAAEKGDTENVFPIGQEIKYSQNHVLVAVRSLVLL
mmetsp:Transcript_14319/g.21842  ORF Transcript_14319/g.21842 Transcript_14319/m.21842 type:complete len:105 (+) Transcript_14319:1225-1539(+)